MEDDREKDAYLELTMARRADIFAPRREEDLPTDKDGNRQYSTGILYSSGKFEPMINVTLPPGLPPLGPWEAQVYSGLCSAYVTGLITTDEKGQVWVTVTPYWLVQYVTGNDKGPDFQRVAEALARLMAVTLTGTGWHIEMVKYQTRNKKMVEHARRVEVKILMHLIEQIDIEQLAVAGRQRMWVKLPEAIREALEAGLVVTVSRRAMQALGTKHPSALRLYMHLMSHQRQDGKVSLAAETLNQVLVPAPSWSLHGPRPSTFRRQVAQMARQIEIADPSMHLQIESATDRSGGWKLTMTMEQAP